jgi:hypothetical protein
VVLELKCPNCGIPHRQEDIFCRKCGKRLRPDNDDPLPADSFRPDALDLLETLNDFRAWIEQRKKTNARFMKAYKKRLDDIGPVIKQFKHKYGNSEGGRLKQFELVQEIFTCFSRPVRFMETKLRPSVGMGVWQERWMMTTAVEDYLKECCREADHLFDELMNKLPLPGKAK